MWDRDPQSLLHATQRSVTYFSVIRAITLNLRSFISKRMKSFTNFRVLNTSSHDELTTHLPTNSILQGHLKTVAWSSCFGNTILASSGGDQNRGDQLRARLSAAGKKNKGMACDFPWRSACGVLCHAVPPVSRGAVSNMKFFSMALVFLSCHSVTFVN